jgi:hypothetical protein
MSDVVRRLLAVTAVCAFTASAAQEPELDAYTGFKMTGDWELVRNNCTTEWLQGSMVKVDPVDAGQTEPVAIRSGYRIKNHHLPG